MNSINLFNNKLLSIVIIGLIVSSSIIPIRSENEIYDPDIETVILFTPKELDEFSQWHAMSKSTQLWLNAITAGLYDISYEEDDDPYIEDAGDYYQYYHVNIAKDFPEFINDKTFRVDINRDFKFPSGELLTIEDILFTYQVALSPAINKNSYHTYSKYFDSNDSIVIIDDDTVEFRLNQPYLFYLELLTLNIIPKSEFQKEIELENFDWNDQSGKYAVGAGPYKIDQINLDMGEIVLIKNTYNTYWQETTAVTIWGYTLSSFDRIIVKNASTIELAVQLATGDYRSIGDPIIDPSYNLNVDDANFMEDTSDLRGVSSERTRTTELAYNHLHPVFGSGENLTTINDVDRLSKARDIRRAISLAIKRDYISYFDNEGDEIGPGRSTRLIKPKITTTGFNVFELRYSYERSTYELARWLMSSAGYNYSDLETDHFGYTNSFFNVSLSLLNDTRCKSIAERIKYDLGQIGIGITPIIYPDNEYYELMKNGEPLKLYDEGGFDIMLREVDWGLLFDPTPYYHSDMTSQKNIYNYNSSELDELIEIYTSSIGDEPVESSYHSLINYISESEISTPLYHTIRAIMFDKDVLMIKRSVDIGTFYLNWVDILYDVTEYGIYDDPRPDPPNQNIGIFIILLISIIPLIFYFRSRKKWNVTKS